MKGSSLRGIVGALIACIFVSGCSKDVPLASPPPPTSPSVKNDAPTWNFDDLTSMIHNAPASIASPVVVDRLNWDPNYAPGTMRDQDLADIHTLVIHNTETAERDEAGMQKVIREHIQERKWSDIGYHFLIALDSRDGHWKVFQGRPMEKIGAHAGKLRSSTDPSDAGTNLNPNTLGIALVGAYSWRTNAKVAEMGGMVPPNLRGTPEGDQLLARLLAPYASPSASETDRQPPREAIEVLLQLVDSLFHDARLKSLKNIRGHGALAAVELHPDLSEKDQFDLAINPGHTDCPGHGMLHAVRALQDRYQ
jgi:hypothetical protein